MNPRGRRRQETENIVGRSYPTETIERPRWPRNSLSLSLARYKQTAWAMPAPNPPINGRQQPHTLGRQPPTATEQEQDRRGNVPSEGGQVMSPAHGPGQDSGICHGRRNCTATMIGISLHSHDLWPLLFGPSGATTLSCTIAAAKICSLLWFFIVALSGCLPMPTTMGHFASYIYSCTVPPHSMGHGHIWSPSHHGRKNFHFSTKSCD